MAADSPRHQLLAHISHCPANYARRAQWPGIQILNELAEVSSELAALGITRSHDLSGRMFQRLIADRKFLATFYTLPVSATYLLSWPLQDSTLTGPIHRLLHVFGSEILLRAPAHSSRRRIAAYWLVPSSGRRRQRITHGDDGKRSRRGRYHACATHLTISMLSSVHPTHTFRRTQVHTLPYGTPPEGSGLPISLGSLDFCSAVAGQDLFGTGVRVASGEREDEELTQRDAIQRDFALAHGSLDLVIMNPPSRGQPTMRAPAFPCPLSRGLQPATMSNTPCQDVLLVYRERSRIRPPAMATQVLPQIFLT